MQAYEQTKNCIVCFAPAKSWTGHVLRRHWFSNKLDTVIAGWCLRHKRLAAKEGFRGCYSHRMGCERSW